MSTLKLRRLRSFWILWGATIVLACASTAFAQQSYKITDMGLVDVDKFAFVRD